MYLPTEHPEKRDIVISRLPGPRVTYALSSVPGGDQIVYATYDNALQWAQTFAAVQNVDVWVRKADGDLTRIARHRVISPARRTEKAHERSVDGLAG